MKNALDLAKISVLAAATMVTSAAIAKPPEAQLNYLVNHPLLGCVGLNKNLISYEGDRILIESEGSLLAKIIVEIRRENFERREVYENGQLVEYSSTTVTKAAGSAEEQFQVSTQIQDGNLILSTDDGEYQVPENTFTTNPLFVESAGAINLIGSKTGVLHTVEITEGEIEPVELETGVVEARHYTLSSDTSTLTDLWYDENDVLVRFIVNDGGSAVEIILTQKNSCDG